MTNRESNEQILSCTEDACVLQAPDNTGSQDERDQDSGENR
ncbi:hypothetical protein [Pseudodesulfovibrio sp.]